MEEKQINESSTFEEHFNEKNIEVIEVHSITEEAFENMGEESIHENVSPNSNLVEIRGEGPNSIDQTENDPISDCEKNKTLESTSENVSPKSNLNRFRGEVILFLDNVDKILEKDTFYCYSCGAEDWFDCDCSYSEYESKSEKKVAKSKKKIIKTSGEIDTNRNSSETKKGSTKMYKIPSQPNLYLPS